VRVQPQFPGSTAVSGLRVYDWEAADQLHGGSPHVHLVSTEGYVVVGGEGELHTLTSDGEAREPLGAGTVLWFSPGTIHRLVNDHGLEILTVMQNAGLPEAGDAVLTFPRSILDDLESYARAATLPRGSEADVAEAARKRRDLALEGYDELRHDFAQRGEAALTEFYELAGRIVRPKVKSWKKLWSETVEAEALRTRRHLDSLETGDTEHLREAALVRATQRSSPRAFGMCGRLQLWDAPEN
jgi:mannose-6-phosphate isomerase-like protein (cupin superfamily)